MDKTKLAAAIAAVFAYIKTSEEAAGHSVPEGGEPVSAQAVQPQPVLQPGNSWGISGRQTHMQANAMIQLRMFK
ncbi:hypothetical protein [Desulfobacula sp.]|uniref:hypothetical protein n=1 Tax=Desulfobacula sp. TaxID=2593537 RepID=UPI00260FFEF2|nr:hypothetical protein [Desulfobacula sp.]